MRAVSALEVERKYDVDADLPVPDLAGLPGVAGLAPVREVLLEATYHDTADLHLRRAGVTLRRRTGGADAGWHLKTPAGPDREELRLPTTRATVPPGLRRLVRGPTRGQPLQAVAVLRTRRGLHHLLDAGGEVLLEVADDVVAASRPDGTGLRWREWEAELHGGDEALLDAVQARLLAAGATHAGHASKLGRVLPTGGGPWWSHDEHGGPPQTAGEVVLRHLHEQLAALVLDDPAVRRDLPDAVHTMRVATRRLRSALATARPLLDRGATDPVRDELAWLAGLLGAARDAEVQHARLRGLLDAEPELVGPALARVDGFFDRRRSQGHAEVVAALDGARYLALLGALDGLLAAPPLLPAAADPPEDRLAHLVRRSWRRLDRRLAAAHAAEPGPERDELLHAARKDAKRARYLAEAAAPALGKRARRTARAAEALQEALGEHQDAVLTRAVLRELADEAHAAGEPTYTYGRLDAIEQRGRSSQALDRARRRAGRRKVRGWFS